MKNFTELGDTALRIFQKNLQCSEIAVRFLKLCAKNFDAELREKHDLAKKRL